MANYALMALMDSDPTAMGYFSAALTQDLPLNDATTSSTAPSEKWPYSGNAGTYVIAGGDQPFIGKLLTINASNNVPSNIAANWVLGATFPVSSVWTGAPLGAAWDIPTVALQNAAGAYVAPSTAAAKAAEADATLASTSDPTTNNLVTFNASTTDAAAYNNYMMEETYLVVPTTGLPANKDTALADFIRFALGPKGQTDIESFGAAPATSAMDAAGLKVGYYNDSTPIGSVPMTRMASSCSVTFIVPSSAASAPPTRPAIAITARRRRRAGPAPMRGSMRRFSRQCGGCSGWCARSRRPSRMMSGPLVSPNSCPRTAVPADRPVPYGRRNSRSHKAASNIRRSLRSPPD